MSYLAFIVKNNNKSLILHGVILATVFDDIRQSPFSVKEAAEYLEVADITVRRWVKEDKLRYQKIGRSLVFDPDDLKALKKKRKRGNV